MKQLVCLKCGHRWYKRVVGTPVRCPQCRTPLWNKPRKYKLSPARMAKRSRS